MTPEEQKTVAFLHERKKSYQASCGSAVSEPMMQDLARFCRADETCVVPGDRDRTYVLEGRREVWLRIQQHLNLPPEQLFALFSGKPTTGETDG